MAMNMKTSKKLKKGFMCHSPSSTLVCMPKDQRSMIVPRRPNISLDEQGRLVNCTGYVRLGDQHRAMPAPSITKSLPSISSLKKNQEKEPNGIANTTIPLAISDNAFQVVVMRVSIHCQGCADKVKKHLSRMEGVTSFSIDLENKRVTVKGHVSPSGVLDSISKVKKAEFWPC
ncbi:hypothetical protein CASFOL_017974 [Castilleja foliolosa]|uniref:HMA domain-containing protein n=1 Tax=Castilleja foliolosa TaxID=1961234 RepID=A0ABD3DA58_9LAMI